jgi:hypothetical protein
MRRFAEQDSAIQPHPSGGKAEETEGLSLHETKLSAVTHVVKFGFDR